MAKTLESWKEAPYSFKTIGRRREGLHPKQVIILHILSKTKMLSKDELCKRAKVHPTTQWAIFVGSTNKERRKAREEESGFPTLITLGFVEHREIKVEDIAEIVYQITSEGREALERALLE